MRHLLSSKFIKRVTQHCNRCLKNVYINNQASKMCSMKATTSDNDKDIHPGGDWPRRVVSGLQPTGALHIGNYFGAIRRCVRLQDRGEDLMIFIADLHSLTTHQAADVLVYRGTHVPVGADQLQHLQVASQLVRTFHHRFGRVFPVPRALLPDDGADRLRSLRDPSKKMSKSDTDPKSRVLLTDDDDVIALKIRKAVTDFTPRVTYEPETRPGVANLVAIHCLAEDKLPEEAVEEAEGLTTAQYKRTVAAALARALAPVRERARELRARPALLRDVLRHGAARARPVADDTYAAACAAAGLR